MKRKKAEKLLMSVGLDRNAARHVMRGKLPQESNFAWLTAVLYVAERVETLFERDGIMTNIHGFHLRGRTLKPYEAGGRR